MASALQPTPRARLRRALGLAAALATLSLGTAPAVSAPLDVGLFTLPGAQDQPAQAPTPPEVELRPVEQRLLDVPLLPEPTPAPSPAPELTPLLAPSLGALDDAGKSLLSHLTSGSSSTPAGDDPTAPGADAPQGSGSPSSEPTTGVAAPEAGASDRGAGAASPATPTSSGTVTAATLMPVIDAVSRPIGPSRRSREIAATDPGGSSRAPVRVASAPLRPRPAAASTGSPAPGGTAPPTPAPTTTADPPRIPSRPAPAAIPHAAERVVGAVADAGRSPWLPVALLLATVAYVLGQRLMDRGSKLSHAGHGDEPDDELIEL